MKPICRIPAETPSGPSQYPIEPWKRCSAIYSRPCYQHGIGLDQSFQILDGEFMNRGEYDGLHLDHALILNIGCPAE